VQIRLGSLRVLVDQELMEMVGIVMDMVDGAALVQRMCGAAPACGMADASISWPCCAVAGALQDIRADDALAARRVFMIIDHDSQQRSEGRFSPSGRRSCLPCQSRDREVKKR